MEGKTCGYCKATVEPSADLCPECGFEFVAKEPVGKLELTDEQIAALAGFAEAKYNVEKGKTKEPVRGQKLMMTILVWFILPSLATMVAQRMHLLPDFGNLSKAFNMPSADEVAKP